MAPRRRNARPLTPAELEAVWRPYPSFIGPVGPPMWLWVRDREKQRLWRIKVSLSDPENREAWRQWYRA
jgi:hypothetical protein